MSGISQTMHWLLCSITLDNIGKTPFLNCQTGERDSNASTVKGFSNLLFLFYFYGMPKLPQMLGHYAGQNVQR